MQTKFALCIMSNNAFDRLVSRASPHFYPLDDRKKKVSAQKGGGRGELFRSAFSMYKCKDKFVTKLLESREDCRIALNSSLPANHVLEYKLKLNSHRLKEFNRRTIHSISQMCSFNEYSVSDLIIFYFPTMYFHEQITRVEYFQQKINRYIIHNTYSVYNNYFYVQLVKHVYIQYRNMSGRNIIISIQIKLLCT